VSAQVGLLAVPESAKRKETVKFSKGDTVVVVEGALKNITGTVESTQGDRVVIRPQHKDLKVGHIV
jgi:transcription antitermination factor NusG